MSLNVVMNNQLPLHAQHVRSAAQTGNAFVPNNLQYVHGTGSHVVLQGGNYGNQSHAYVQRGLTSGNKIMGTGYVAEGSVPYVMGSPQRLERVETRAAPFQALAVQPFYMEPQVQPIIYQQPQVISTPVMVESSVAAQGNGFWQLECERLQVMIRERTEECEAWRTKCKHLEAHISGVQLGDANQTREWETRMQYSSSEITRLNAVISDLSAECELWKRKCMELDGLRTLLHDKHRLEHDNGQLTAIIEDLNMKLQGLDEERLRFDYMKRAHIQEKEFFEAEILKLHSIIESKNAELAEWGARYTQIEIRAGAGKDLEAKIVVLGSEIERLHAILRTNLEEMERYQVTIQQMERSLGELRGWQNKYSEAENEILRLRESVEQWIAKYSKLEHSYGDFRSQDSKIQTLAIEIEKLNATLIAKQREIDELQGRLRYSEANSSYKSEIQRLQILLEEKNRELEEFRISYSRQEALILSLRSQETSIREYENNLALLSQEIERLNSLLRKKQEEIDRLNSSSSEVYRLKEMIDSRNRVISEWEEKYSRLEISLREYRLKETSISQYEDKIALLSQEIERQNSLLTNYRSEIEAWRSKYSQLEMTQSSTYETRIREYSTRISDYETKFAMLSQEIERLRSMQTSKDNEIENLRRRVSQFDSYSIEVTNYKTTIRDYEDKIALLSQEIERLNSINRSYISDIESWKSRYSSLEVRISDHGKFEQENHYLRDRLTEYENKIALLSQEIERLNGILRSRTLESEQWSSKYKDIDMKMALLSQEIERLRSVSASKEKEIEEWRIRFSKSEVTIREFSLQQGRITEYENKIALLSQEIERLNRLLSSKNSEIDEWRVKLSRSESSTREITILQSKISDYESKFAMLAQEIERLNSVISSKNSEIDEWRVRYSKVETTTREITLLQSSIRDYEDKFAMLSQEITRLNSMLQNKNKEIDEWKYKYSSFESSSSSFQYKLSEYESKIALLTQEIERLNSLLKSRMVEVEEWKSKFASSESRSRETMYNEERFRTLSAEIERYKRMYEESSSLSSKVSFLEANCQKYLLTMVLLFAEIEHLRSKYLEKEVEVENVISETKRNYIGATGGESQLAQNIRRISYQPSNERNSYVTREVVTKTYNSSTANRISGL